VVLPPILFPGLNLEVGLRAVNKLAALRLRIAFFDVGQDCPAS
jgi:hypothetical protein